MLNRIRSSMAVAFAAVTAAVLAPTVGPVPALAGKPDITATGPVADGVAEPSTHGSGFRLVGRNPLVGRGMNAAPAIYRNWLYVGNRTDGSATCVDATATCPHPHPGVLVLSIHNPARPRVVGEIGPPEEGVVGQTSRELRVWPQAGLLMVMNFRCSAAIHVCPAGTPDTFTIKFFDVRRNPVNPPLVATYVPSRKPHEMYLWLDPQRPGRALLYLSTPAMSTDPAVPNLIVTDISRAREGVFPEIATGNWNHLFAPADVATNNLFVHSMGLTADGTRTYLAYLAGEFLVLDTSDLANAVPNPQLRLLTDPARRPRWANPNGHSAVKVPGRQLALTTDEIYGKKVGPDHGCPWGWMRLIDIRDEVAPGILGEFRVPQNDPAFCQTPAGQDDFAVSYAAHNPTVLPNLALITWHSGGVQAIDIAEPTNPRPAGQFLPRPLDQVATEDPALSVGPSKVVMWSYPIIRNGLIYVVDVRNGLYVLAYTGPHRRQVSRIRFLEGNSNLGDYPRLDRAPRPHSK